MVINMKIKKERIKAGKRAGHLYKDGHRRITVDGETYLEEKLIWLYHYGYMPKCLYHINGIKNDNRIENLIED